MKTLFVFLLGVCIAISSFGDYLVTNRKTSLKHEPSSQSSVLLQIEANTPLSLLDDGHQTNGYYHVRHPLSTEDGWIYRTFVRRFTGESPSDEPPAGTPTSPHATGQVDVRVIDVGPGLCTLIRLPDNRYIIYDAGHWRGNGNTTAGQINDFIPEGSVIELMVLSHTDSDHIGAAGNILQEYHVKKVLSTGYERSMTSSDPPSGTFNRLVNALRENPGTEHINLHERDSTIVPGTRLVFGDVSLTFLCGFGEPLSTWGLTDRGEKINSVSIVMKLEYQGKSILFCGDAVGRHRGDPAQALLATEHFLVQQASSYLRSNIIIAPHHGADNGSSSSFIEQVQPETVIFSAGHDFNHPTRAAAERYLHVVDLQHIYRTDRGDDEGTPQEWSHLRVPGCIDDYADDDIHIELHHDGTYRIYYIQPDHGCGDV